MSDLEANKAIALKFIEALGRLDVEEFLGYMTEDVIFETPGDWPGGGIKTKAQVAREFPPMREVLPNGLKFTIFTVTAEADRVHIELAGTSKTADGEDYNNRYHYAFVIRDGMICGFRDYMDTNLAMKMLVPALARHGAVQEDRDRQKSV